MTQVTLQLDGDALREATVQAMLGVLTPEVKAQVLEQAINQLLKPSTNAWDKKRSPIELAFDEAVQRVAKQEASRMVTEDAAIQASLKELLRKTADKVLGADMEELAQRMADAFVISMRKY